MEKRNIYLDKLPLTEAKEIILNNLAGNYREATERVKVEDASGRVTAEAVYAEDSSPHYYAAAMDGFAVDVDKTFGASKRDPKELTIGQEAFFVDTGDAVPEGCNGVIMIEDVNQLDEATIEITASVAPGQHIRSIGEDILASQLLAPVNTKLGPSEIGGLLAGGITEIEVRKEPEVAILPTGTELVDPGSSLQPGEIVEYNSRVIASQIREWGAVPVKADKVEDDYELIKNRVDRLSQQYDLVLIIAGSSAGAEDYTSQVIENLGELLFHGVAIKPGKPLMAGVINEKLVIGLPGYPVSAYLGTQLFVRPVIERLLGLTCSQPEKVKAELTQNLTSKLGEEEFVRVNVAHIDGDLKAVPLQRGAGVINSVMKSDGFIRIPALKQGMKQNKQVEVELRRDIDYNQNLLIAGEEDLAYELLCNQIKLQGVGLNLKFKNMASETAVDTLEQKAANAALVKTVGMRQETVVVNLAVSEVGLVVRPDNSLGINGVEDLSQEGLSFVNQQQGRAARRLLDSRLETAGINTQEIVGYRQEEITGRDAANLVKEGIIDVGLASRGVAELFNLDFISLGQITSSLVILESEVEREELKKLLEVVRSNEYKSQLQKIAGYNTEDCGEIIDRK
ncbi:molybdopterin biosynthesis protein [Acetohalobium arabaticum]|uniref:Molybdopterin molybdenumtransferase n=1 Tax=Acetohalobium arabaticum (strain ATCC 49924 / DSM 5501 / Z-7288) TaxID=574087 RepID=D9QT63_ACEAZ|nr:molybdopterin biosynthesis protein [Acetohalobium arabaticum]ADL13563.1 molybdenum cofactor synthesis domain protein [Acetohalobium arabaticum DSM 5501]